MNQYVKVTTERSGQPRPYADHEFVQVVQFSADDGRIEKWLEERGLPLIRPRWVERDVALAVARIFCPYEEPTDPNYNWASRHLVSFEPLEPTTHPNDTVTPVRGTSDRWRIHVRALYTD